MCARTSNMKSTKTERKFTQERKVGHRGCVGRGNVVVLRRKWQEALRTIQPSEGTCFGVRGRQRCVVRWIPHQAKTSVGATRVSVSDRRTPMRVQLRPRANERWIPHRAREPGTRAGLRGKLRRRAEDARELRRRDEHYRPLIPVVMATPWLTCARAQGMRTGARRRADEQACLKRDTGLLNWGEGLNIPTNYHSRTTYNCDETKLEQPSRPLRPGDEHWTTWDLETKLRLLNDHYRTGNLSVTTPIRTSVTLQ